MSSQVACACWMHILCGLLQLNAIKWINSQRSLAAQFTGTVITVVNNAAQLCYE
jgi:hypothetical protein